LERKHELGLPLTFLQTDIVPLRFRHHIKKLCRLERNQW
jgi:hypothetical protein